jgi:GntR family transcriptional regulator
LYIILFVGQHPVTLLATYLFNMAAKAKVQEEPIEFKIDHDSPLPLHVQVENLIRKLIESPHYQNGKLLPKEIELAKRLGISRNTIRQATNKLEHENLLIRKKGVGTRAVKNTVSTRLNNWLSFSEEMHNKGVEFVNFHIEVTWVTADTEVAQILQIEEGRKVLKLERLRGVKKGPFVYFISYFHPRVGLTGKEDFSRHLYEIMEQEYATIAAISKEKINAIAATTDVAKKLNVKKGEPILLRKRIVCDPGDRPIEFNVGYYRGDSFSYEIDIKR